MNDIIEAPTEASSVYAFKNGYCLIVKKFEIPPNKDDEPLQLFDFPSDPIHGTFSIQTTLNIKISSIRRKKIFQSIEEKCTTISELILANMGGDTVELLIENIQPNPTWLEGTIEMNLPKQGDSINVSLKENHIILFKTIVNEEILAVPLSSILSIRGKDLKTILIKKTMKNCLLINYTNESTSNAHGLMKYLTFGIAWVPFYELDLITNVHSDVKMLRLSLNCTILNSIGNIQIENLFCVLGYPNLSKLIDIIDPLFTETTTKDFLDQLKTSNYCVESTKSGNYMANQYNLDLNTSKYVIISDTNDHEQINNEFYSYKFQNIRLEHNEKVSLPIFNMQLPYKDICHCQINRNKPIDEEEKKEMNNNDHINTSKVWHSIEFDNQSGHTLTTASVFITEDNQRFIAHETLNFTPKDNRIFLRLNTIPEISVTNDEKSPDVTQSRVKIFDMDYTKEQWNGTITITNAIQTSVKFSLKIRLLGNISKYSTQPNFDTIQQGTLLINQLHDIRWNLQVEPQQTKVIQYGAVRQWRRF